MNDHTSTKVPRIPNCDFCGNDHVKEAVVDGRTHFGYWAYMCEEHFVMYGVGLGLGHGQRLILEV